MDNLQLRITAMNMQQIKGNFIDYLIKSNFPV